MTFKELLACKINKKNIKNMLFRITLWQLLIRLNPLLNFEGCRNHSDMSHSSYFSCECYFFAVQDAETRLEDQISRLVLDKQELEWEKVRLGLASASPRQTDASLFPSCLRPRVRKAFSVKLKRRQSSMQSRSSAWRSRCALAESNLRFKV